MLALHSQVMEALWQVVAPKLPAPAPDQHPLGCHRRRLPDRSCFEALLFRLVTGCSWRVAGSLGKGSATTLRRRRDAWLAAGVFTQVVNATLAAYDRLVGLDPSEVVIDTSLQKAPYGGEGTGPNPTDRGKLGFKWSVATETGGIPVGWTTAAANRHDSLLLEPTLRQVAERGVLATIQTLHLDRAYAGEPVRQTCLRLGIPDLKRPPKRPPGAATTPRWVPLGKRWPVERTNSWFSNFGQLRRSTDRRIAHRLAQLDLAITCVLTVKLFKLHLL